MKIHNSQISTFEPEIADVLAILEAVLWDFYHDSAIVFRKADYTQDLCTLRKRIQHEGLSFATLTLPKLASGLLQYLETGFGSYPGFKLKAKKTYPSFLGGMFKRLYNGVDDKDSICFRNIYRISNLFTKLRGPMNPHQLAKQYADFLTVDDTLAHVFDNVLEDNETFQILQLARYYANEAFGKMDPYTDDGFLPRPGPGATCTPTLKGIRYAPNTWYTQHQGTMPYEDWFYSHPWDIPMSARRYATLKKYAKAMPYARFKFVPKKVGKARGMCIEENESQYLQQCIANGMKHHIKSTKLKGFVNFDDQTINGALAMQSSASGEYATLDMSEASDRIARDLVSWMYQDNPEFHNILMTLSTRLVKSPTEAKNSPKWRMINKFAPMGSGLCFPIMSCTHYFLLKAIMRRHKEAHQTLTDIYVYGDDLIVPTHIADAVTTYLPKFGMKLNIDKSFSRCLFRESCGVHAYNGVDVTPVYIKYTPSQENVDIIMSCVENENGLTKAGLVQCARFLRSRLVKLGVKHLMTDVKSPILSFKRDNIGCCSAPEIRRAFRRRWNIDLQSFEYRVRVINHVLAPYDILCDNEAYLRFLLQKTRKSRHFSEKPEYSKLSWAWVAESAACAVS